MRDLELLRETRACGRLIYQAAKKFMFGNPWETQSREEKKMTAIETIKELYTLQSDLLQSAAQAADFMSDDSLLRSVTRWAALRCQEDEATVLNEARKLIAEDAIDLTMLRDLLETGLKSWKFEGHIFGSEEQRDEWLKTRSLITVHRGTKQIGGSITEISMGRTTVLVDFGQSLPGSCESISDEEIIKKIFDKHHRSNDRHIDAVFFTHYHGDHVGLMDKIPADIPIYMDSAMLKILQTLHKHSKNAAMQELLAENSKRIRAFTVKDLLHIGDMNIIPFFVDHSAYHANMFLFENKLTGHTVLLSGDFRGTGYMRKSLDMIPKLIHDHYHKQVDVLLTEGTMMNRSVEEEHLLTEWDVHKEAKFFMKDHRQIFVVCSSTNFDSLTSICNAARANNIPIYGSHYIIDMLKTFSDMAGKYTGLYHLPPIKGIDEMIRVHPKEGVLLLGSLLHRETKDAYSLYDRYGCYMSDYKPHLIYSMWQGHLNPKHPAYNKGLATFVKRFGSSVKYIHSTGHADKETLAKFIENVAPRKYIIPFHTENAAGFRTLPIETKYKDMIILPDDGDTIEI